MPQKIDAKILENLVADLRESHGDNLASVVLYGSIVAGDHVELRSDHNLLIALNEITPADLRKSEAPMRDWRKLGQPIPVYFTIRELQDAADVFPIEFLQMEKARKVLFGSDPFEFVKISRANLRHQTEYELRTKLIRLRRLYIPASTSAERLVALMTESLSSFAALFRAVLMLLGEEPPVVKEESVRRTARVLKLDPAPFERIFQLRKDKPGALAESEANDLFGKYLAQIDRVIEVVDRISESE